MLEGLERGPGAGENRTEPTDPGDRAWPLCLDGERRAEAPRAKVMRILTVESHLIVAVC